MYVLAYELLQLTIHQFLLDHYHLILHLLQYFYRNLLQNHLEDVHALETFYGDQTLQSLISHSKTVINNIIDFQEKHYEVEVIQDEPDAPEETPSTEEE